MTVVTKTETKGARPVMDAPELAPRTIAKPDLLTVEDAKALSVERMTDLFKAHLNPGQLHFMKLLGFHKIKEGGRLGNGLWDTKGCSCVCRRRY